VNAYLRAKRQYVTFTGRMTRSDFWIFTLVLLAILMFALILDGAFGTAHAEKRDIMGFTPGMSFEEADAKVQKQFKQCNKGPSLEEMLDIVCDRKLSLSFSPFFGQLPVLVSVATTVKTTDDEQTVLHDLSQQFDGKRPSKELDKPSGMTNQEYVQFYYWPMPGDLQLRYYPDRGLLLPAPASGTLVLMNQKLIDRHKDEYFRRTRSHVPKL